MSKRKIRVGITMGDPSGVGPALVVKALSGLSNKAEYAIIGDASVLQKATCLLGNRRQVKGPKIIDLANVSKRGFTFGKIDAQYGRASIEYLDKAMELLRKDEIDCLVTAPISKEAIHRAGFNYAGHTEYFATKAGKKDVVMMLLNKYLKISLVTRHVRLKNVPAKLNSHILDITLRLTQACLQKLFLVPHPRLIVCGLNPHASDNGLLGSEENLIIKPLIARVRAKFKIAIDGPVSADVAIAKTFQKQYDCAIAMYHDQALIPLKLIGSTYGVNLTLGLPFVRTSPLHGTAFDIARTPRLIEQSSFVAAVRIATRCASAQRKD